MSDGPASDDIAVLLSQAGLRQEFRLSGLPGGGNNRVYRIDCDGSTLLLKAYFHHPDDPRDRLATEFAFSRFTWERGLRCLPQPLARDDRNHLGLYEFIRGRTLAAEEIGEEHVDQAIAFFVGLNRHKRVPEAGTLPLGSEACFTLAEHLACVQRRIARLVRIEGDSPLDRAAAQWIRGTLGPAWDRVHEHVLRAAAARGVAVDASISDDDRCLSPSDFGFHNAILAEDGRLRFVDFEYAGWDDPAKTVCDFLCQPKLPVPQRCAGRFTEMVVSGLSDAAIQRWRVGLLLPVYRVKWCCIMLNEFLPVGSQRRGFAQESASGPHPERVEQRKQMQLEKVQQALQRVEI